MARFTGALFVLSAVLFGAPAGYTVAQLLQFMRSSIEQKLPDRQVAQYVSHMKLSEKLDAQTVEKLQGEGLGPKTVLALKDLMAASANLSAPRVEAEAPKPAPIPPPSYAEEQQVISDMTDYALNYTKRLPDFLCSQVTRRYADPRFRGSWINVDTVVSKVSYVDGHENYEVKLVNNTMVENKSMESLSGAVSTGEFGSVMHELFDPYTKAEFHFDHWGTLRGTRVYVFNYAVEQDRSKYSIDYDRKVRIVTAYQGKVYVNKASHQITRITSEAANIPASFPVRSASSIIDYDMATIGTRDYMLPTRAEVKIADSEIMTRNLIEFRSYRKFGADAVIKYDDIPEAGPEQKEEPLKAEPPK